MNKDLETLLKMVNDDDDECIATLVLVNAYHTRTATVDQELLYELMHPAVAVRARAVIREFSNREHVFNLDHVAWQLGIDVTPEGPQVEIVVPTHDSCVEEDMAYDGHIAAPGRGIAMHCRTCQKAWVKIGPTFYPADEGPFLMTIDDVR